jgi:hypothetical protein
VLSAIPWITDSTTVQNIVIIAIVSNITSQIQLHKSQTLQKHSGKQSGNEPPSSSRATGRHVGMQSRDPTKRSLSENLHI